VSHTIRLTTVVRLISRTRIAKVLISRTRIKVLISTSIIVPHTQFFSGEAEVREYGILCRLIRQVLFASHVIALLFVR
jgi:hypothetical protein